MRRWPPVVLGLLGAVLALALAVGAGALVKSFDDDDAAPEPEVELTFDGTDDESGEDDLIGGDVEGDAAPDVSFALLEGGSMKLSDLEGTPVIVNFFGAWCGPCRTEMPDFETVFQEVEGEVAFLGISVRESPEDARGLIDDTGVTYTIGRDPSGEITQAFDVVNFPSTYLLGADGTVLATHPGALDADGLRDLITRAS